MHVCIYVCVCVHVDMCTRKAAHHTTEERTWRKDRATKGERERRKGTEAERKRAKEIEGGRKREREKEEEVEGEKGRG